jgi:PAS domain S-box-containing protein
MSSKKVSIKKQQSECEELFHNLSEILDEGVVITEDGKIIGANKKVVEMFGYALSELIGKPAADFAHSLSRQVVQNHLLTASNEPYEAAVVAKNGSVLWVEIAGKSFVHNGQTGRISVLRDITARKKFEEAIDEWRDRYEKVVKASGMILYDTNFDHDDIIFSGNFTKIIGYSLEESPSRSKIWLDYVHSHDRAQLAAKQDLLIKTGSAELEYRFKRADGVYINVRDRGDALFDAEGKIKRILGLIEDITDRKRTEEQLMESLCLATLNGEINNIMIQGRNLHNTLNSCATALVHHLNVAFARIWTLNKSENVLELQASAGMYTHLNGFHSRIPVGKLKVGLIASNRMPHLTNDVVEDPLISDKEWAQREGIIAFAGYPLTVEERLVGVICVFARRCLSDLTLQAMGSVSNAIANGIERKHLEECQQSLATRLEGAREDERRHLSRLLHDDIGQEIAAASIKLERIEKRLIELFPEENAVISDVVIAQELLHRNQQSLRQVAHVLHPRVLEQFGLTEALRRFTREINNSSKEQSTVISFDFSSDLPRLKFAVEVAIYRMVQEAITNSLKHAHAKLISLKLCFKNDLIYVRVRDDGCGFDLKKIESSGIGLASMYERAEIICAKLNITSKTGVGTEITFEVPVK